MSSNWRDIFNQMSWENYYILDADDCGLKQARSEKRVKLAGDEFRKYVFALCEMAEAEGMSKLENIWTREEIRRVQRFFAPLPPWDAVQE